MGSEERVGVFSHFAHSRNKITQRGSGFTPNQTLAYKR